MLLQVNTFLQGACNPHARAFIHMAIAWLATVICLIFLVSAQDTRPQQPGNPIIAHITMPLSDCTSFATPPPGVDASGGCVNILYVKWLAAVGVRTVPIAWNAVWEDVQRILDSTNGVLLPGGDLTGAEWTAYQQNMKAVVDYTKRRNQDGDPFVLWGTCQGFQVVATILADDPSILRCNLKGVEGVQLPLNMTSSALGSVMFPTSTQSTGMYQLFATKPVTLNLHSCGISPQDWDRKDLLRSQYKVLATNVDSTGKTFISAYEGVNTNILAVQFHPERTQFEFDASFILHTDDDMDAAWYLARLLRNRLQQCLLHRYNTPNSANAALIDTYPVTLLGWGKGYYWVPQNGQATAPAHAVGEGGDRNFASVAWTLGLMTILAGIVTGFFIMFCRRRPVVRAPRQPAGVYDVEGKGTIVEGSVIS